MTSPDLYLASQSPRRGQLLDQIGVRFATLAVEVDETRRPGEHAEDYVRRLALEKARAGHAALSSGPQGPVLGADTAVVVNETILGKPSDCAHAVEMLAMLSGSRHRVLSAVAIVAGAREAVRLSTSTVWFRDLSGDEREGYCVTGEPLDKAGAYAIQGLASAFVTRLDGSYSGVMGLPLFETAELLTRFGIPFGLARMSHQAGAGPT